MPKFDTYLPAIKVVDVSDISAEAIYVIGGFVGELILTFNAMKSCIALNSQLAEFRFEVDKIVDYLSECLDDYPEAAAYLMTCIDPFQGVADTDEKARIDHCVKNLLQPNVLSQFGLRFLVENAVSLSIDSNVITDIFTAIATVSLKTQKDLVPEPAEGDEGYDHIDEVRAKNEEIVKENAKWQKVQSKCQIAQQELADTFGETDELPERVCYVTLLNFKDPEETLVPPEEPTSKKSLP